MKSELRYASSCEYLDDFTPINDNKKILSSRNTEDALTIYLAERVITLCKTIVVTATRKSNVTNSEQVPSTGISSHDEADTIMMIRALEIVQTKKENVVDFFTQDTDWWVLILRRLP